MTNLTAKLILVLVTNWTTVSKTVPVGNYESWQLAQVQTMLNQVGRRSTNYVAVINWNGTTKEVVLQSVEAIDEKPLERSIPEPLGFPNRQLIYPHYYMTNLPAND